MAGSSDFSSFVKELQSLTGSSANPVVSSSAPEPVGDKRVKLLIVSTHTNQVNGYSKVVYHLIQQLAQQKWLDVVHFGTQKMMNADLARPYPASVRAIDGTAMEKEKQLGFAFSELPSVILSEKPDVVWIYNDMSVICTYLEAIRKAIEKRTFKIWAYIDITYPSPPQGMMDTINRDVERIFCFTKSWKEVLKNQGATRPIDVLNHGVDSTVYRPIPRDVARQTLGLPKDIFLFTSLNKNIPRKRLDLLIIAFTKLMIRFPMKPLFLLIVADKGDRGGYPLFEIFAREIKLNGASVDQFGNRLMITTKDTCYRDEDVNLLYNCGDVGVSCADGEGFGLCTFEQMSLGVPQIVPEINGYTEYCLEDNSLRVKPRFRGYLPQAHHSVMGEINVVDPEDVSKAMERYVFDDDLRKLHAKLGQQKALQYSWEKVSASLVKRLKALLDEEDD
jgi:glycosyltransferase involved in cell wall biosynthesis